MEDVRTVEVDQPKKKGGRFMKKVAWFLFIVLVGYFGIMYLLGAVLVYNKGNSVGYIYKFSHKGYLFKTNEGILKTGFINIGNTSTPNEEWAFSVDNDSIARQITALDQRIAVKLYYKEFYIRLFYKGDTKYFVYKMEVMPNR